MRREKREETVDENQGLQGWEVAANSMCMEHHVYFWLKQEHQNPSDRAKFEQALENLFAIGLVGGGRWGVPAKVAPRPVLDQSWDYALSMTFSTLADHDAYQDVPEHHEFLAAYKPWWTKVLVMDLE